MELCSSAVVQEETVVEMLNNSNRHFFDQLTERMQFCINV